MKNGHTNLCLFPFFLFSSQVGHSRLWVLTLSLDKNLLHALWHHNSKKVSKKKHKHTTYTNLSESGFRVTHNFTEKLTHKVQNLSVCLSKKWQTGRHAILYISNVMESVSFGELFVPNRKYIMHRHRIWAFCSCKRCKRSLPWMLEDFEMNFVITIEKFLMKTLKIFLKNFPHSKWLLNDKGQQVLQA